MRQKHPLMSMGGKATVSIMSSFKVGEFLWRGLWWNPRSCLGGIFIKILFFSRETFLYFVGLGKSMPTCKQFPRFPVLSIKRFSPLLNFEFSSTLQKISIFSATIKVRQICLRQKKLHWTHWFSAMFTDFDSCTKYTSFWNVALDKLIFLQSWSRGFQSSRLYFRFIQNINASV